MEKTDPNHFDPNYRAEILNPLKANVQMRNVHKLAYENFRKYKSNTSFYNASKKTVLDIYPIIDFEQFVINNKIIIRDQDQVTARNFWNSIKNKMRVFNLINYFKRLISKINIKISNRILKLKKNKKILTSEVGENGFLYICTGESYAKECLLSIKSLKDIIITKLQFFQKRHIEVYFKIRLTIFFQLKKTLNAQR